MPSSQNKGTEVVVVRSSQETTGRRRTPRRSSPTSVRSAKAGAGASALNEILFKELPDSTRAPVAPYIWIDHPVENESLRGPVYVVRLGVGGASEVDLSVDKGPWLPCRLASGYWWYDWTAIELGPHVLTARMRTPDGQWYRTPLRHCLFRE